MSSHKTFRIKWFQATKQKQNCPIPQWIQMKTGNKIWYNSKRRQKNQAGSIKSLRYKVAHMLCVKITCVLTNQVTVRTPLLSEQPMGERECLAPDVSRFFISSLWGSIMNMWNLKKRKWRLVRDLWNSILQWVTRMYASVKILWTLHLWLVHCTVI